MFSKGNKAVILKLKVFASFSSALLVVSVVHYSMLILFNILYYCFFTSGFCPVLIDRSCVNYSSLAGDAGILYFGAITRSVV